MDTFVSIFYNYIREKINLPNKIFTMAKTEDGSNSDFDEWSISIDDGRIEIEIEIGSKDYTYDMDTEKLIEID